MQLSRQQLNEINPDIVSVPDSVQCALPEKVLQFGTGVLLRGLPDYCIDRANAQGLFNGRIVVIKSTSTGGTDAFEQQDGLYTVLERGIQNGEAVHRNTIISAVSRVLSAKDEWSEILRCAVNPDIQVVISNTTEVGIVLDPGDANADQPASFPGRLLAILMERHRVLGNSVSTGMVIIPTELIPDNGTKLREIVLQLAKLKGVDDACFLWLSEANDFCNSLVDCIVPGKPAAAVQQEEESVLGYTDTLMIMSEPYRLWAIETRSGRTKQILSFSKAGNGVVIADNIHKFRELKLRLLNATHTLTCGIALLMGFTTVKEAMRNELFSAFLEKLMLEDMVPLVTADDIPQDEAVQFAIQVMDRFRNPSIEHAWLSITAQYSSKMAMRVLPLLQKAADRGPVPQTMVTGFAAYLLFMRSVKNDAGEYTGEVNGKKYSINDDKAGLLSTHWEQHPATAELTAAVLSDTRLWNADLDNFSGFRSAVTTVLDQIMTTDIKNCLTAIFVQKNNHG
jgi:tagaturonate reductase